jgi:hypothetical protein
MKIILSALGIFILICISAKAEEVAFTFSGTLHELDTEFGDFGGRPFEITYTFESATKDANPRDPECGKYIGSIKSGSLTIYADGNTFHWVIKPEEPNNFIEVKHVKNADSYSASANVSGQETGNTIPVTFIIELISENTAALSNDALPSTLKLKSFNSQRIVKFTFTGPMQHVYGTWGIITSGNTPTPE